MSRLKKILICDDDKSFHLALRANLKGKFEFRSAYNTEEAFVILKSQRFDLMVLDIQMRTPDEGLRAIPRFKETDPDMGIVISSGITDYKTVKEALQLGAEDYVTKDAEPDAISITIMQALEKRDLLRRSQQQNCEALHIQQLHVMIGKSPAIEALRKTIERIRQSPANVVITGETGTGKEVVARQLRRSLPDDTLAPFVAMDSSTIQASTAESTLFGYEKGAYTGADRTNKGLFEEADNGIVYFDEIGNMPLAVQAKLLRVIQEREICRLGSSRVIPLNFRVICATNRDLDQMASNGEFKEDLLQRLNVLPIQIPPLRERIEDIPDLIQHFINRQGADGQALHFTDEAITLLQSYFWPGNIRELSNLVSYVAAMSASSEIEVADLPPKLREASRKTVPTFSAPSGDAIIVASSFYEQVGIFERTLLQREYEKEKGNISKLALALGMDRSHLYTKLKEYGIHAGKKRGSEAPDGT